MIFNQREYRNFLPLKYIGILFSSSSSFPFAEKTMNQRTDVKPPKRYIMVLTCQIGLSKTFNIYVSVTSCLQRNLLLKKREVFFFRGKKKRKENVTKLEKNIYRGAFFFSFSLLNFKALEV